jgi:HPt (histidine-containing phosphotransfer) domain-containing protein
MYYILNGTNQIIAADDSLLALCGVKHLNELYLQVAQKETVFDTLSSTNLTLQTVNSSRSFIISKTILSSMIGVLTLISLDKEIEEKIEDISNKQSPIVEDEDEIDKLLHSLSQEEETTLDIRQNLLNDNSDDVANSPLDIVTPKIPIVEELALSIDESLLFDTPKETTIQTPPPIVEETLVEETLDLDTSLDMDLLFDTPKETRTPIVEPLDLGTPLDMDLLFDTPKETPSPIVEPLDLGTPLDSDLLFDTPVGTPAPIQTPIVEPEPVITEKTVVPTPEIAEIIIDVAEVSTKIGITPDDYNTFLNEFIENAIELEVDLEGVDTSKRTEAIETLSDLSHVLYLPSIAEVIHQIAISNDTNRRSTIDTFYQTLSAISILEATPSEQIKPAEVTLTQPIIEEVIEEVIEAPVSIPEPVLEAIPEPQLTIKEQLELNKVASSKSFGTLSLEGIKPKHFDFQLEEAANDLSLPVELIEEFVHDFIDQAHIETKKMLQSYEEGDLDAIQKIGHLLKGASSNLRINALSDTLYKIQFCEESKNLEVLIKDYWAHFLSFEHQINVISQQ